MNFGGFTEEEYERLKIAEKKGLYGHLASWKELFYFQLKIGTTHQIHEIALYAKRKTRLPLKDNIGT